jgi:hypothetical protein
MNDDGEREPIYRSSAEFHREWLSRVFARQDPVWCPDWQQHSEAREVVDALWMAWEDAQAHGHDGPARWFAYYGYPLMRELTDPDGTFVGCDPERHASKTAPLPE